MRSLVDYALKQEFDNVKKVRSKLSDLKELIDWNAFRSLFPEKEIKAGRPAYDYVLKLKCLFLQSWYGLSDEELEFQLNDRLSFRDFLGFPKKIPDYSTIWYFREFLQEKDLADKVWAELQRQISNLNLKVQKGSIQDATFVKAQPGKQSSDKINRGREAKTSRNKDATWTKKNNKNYFGYKLHTKVQRGTKIITEIAVTTAKVHDSNIDLGNENDDVLYRDKAWTGKPTKAKGNGSMKKGKLTIKEKHRNKRITKKRSVGEHPFGTMTRTFKSGTTKLTTNGRVFIQQLMVCFTYNVYRLRFLTRT